jgi:hypothetical protein
MGSALETTRFKKTSTTSLLLQLFVLKLKMQFKVFERKKMKYFLSFFSESLSVNTSTWHQIELALKKKKIRNAVMNDGTNVRTHKLSEREKVKARRLTFEAK